MEITTLFWDVGGVLFSDAEISRPEFKPVLDSLGMEAELSDQIFDRLWVGGIRLGNMKEEIYWQENLKQARNKPTVPSLMQLYRECIRINQPVFDQVIGFTGQYDQFIVSNQSKEWMDYLTEHWQLNRYFKEVFCSADLKLAKPDPKFFEAALTRSGKNSCEILYIDNSPANIEAALNLGIKGILYEGYLEEGAEKLRYQLSYALGCN